MLPYDERSASDAQHFTTDLNQLSIYGFTSSQWSSYLARISLIVTHLATPHRIGSSSPVISDTIENFLPSDWCAVLGCMVEGVGLCGDIFLENKWCYSGSK